MVAPASRLAQRVARGAQEIGLESGDGPHGAAIDGTARLAVHDIEAMQQVGRADLARRTRVRRTRAEDRSREHVPLLDQGGERGPVLEAVRAGGCREQASESPRVHGQREQSLAEGGECARARLDRAEHGEQVLGLIDPVWLGCLVPAERPRVLDAPGAQEQERGREIHAPDVGQLRERARGVLARGPQAHHGAGAESPRATGALVGGVLADRDRLEAIDAGARALRQHAREPAVDDEIHSVDGERGPRPDVGGEDDLARRAGRERGLLLGEREASVQGHERDARLVGEPCERVRRAANLARSGRNTSVCPRASPQASATARATLTSRDSRAGRSRWRTATG